MLVHTSWPLFLEESVVSCELCWSSLAPFLVDWAVKMRIRLPEFETSICDVKYHVSLSTRCVLGKCVYLVTHAMSLFDLQDVCMVFGSLATLDLPMVVDLIGIFVLKGPYCTLTMTDWFLQALLVIPRGSWDDVARRFTMIRWVVQKYGFGVINVDLQVTKLDRVEVQLVDRRTLES
ncbi:alpha-dioxygenase 1-like [Dorcoceras hygrometricum]|uniref:Alpha-dioxygenase 1-like n=1 Tax=Dorcoceras hygrometricum TaxID=472368 RepID=A0A2Z7BU27_9LAMI|nr:alpha-dioxygenase 1-like [Dorcoceras hygrometricum]